MGSAIAAFVCYFIIMLVSYYFGQKHMPIKYDLKSIGLYVALAALLFAISNFVSTPYQVLNLAIKTVLLMVFLWMMVKRDFPLKAIPIVNRFFK
jgi:uncharacterized membrane protein